jgi:AcrR family transcriptional regulator
LILTIEGDMHQTTRAQRLNGKTRREQIIDVTLALVAEHGVRGTTLSRIAAAVGITTPGLYAHFESRKEILLAALDDLFDNRTLPRPHAYDGTALDRLRAIERHHAEHLTSGDDQSLLALFEFVAAPAQEGLRETLGRKHLARLQEIADIVRAGQEEGSVRQDADPKRTAWMILSRAWTGDIAHLMGIQGEWEAECSAQMLDFILNDVAATPQDGPPTPADCPS